VSLQALEDDRTYDIPDFDLEPSGAPPKGLYDVDNGLEEDAPERKGIPMMPILIVSIILLAIALGAWFYLGRGGTQAATVLESPGKTQKPAAAAQEPEAKAPAPEAAATGAAASKGSLETKTADTPKETSTIAKTIVPSAAKAEAALDNERTRAATSAQSYKVPQTIPAEGVRYKIRWGDTLWDISEAFYRNPWKYIGIARFNKIRNPDFIISGSYIRIPPP
jgi:nucleoid-associated protein YgaU